MSSDVEASEVAAEISEAVLADAHAVAAVYGASWPGSAEHVTTAAVQDDLLAMRGVAFWEQEIHAAARQGGRVWVTRCEGRLVGFAGSMVEDDRWELVWLFIAPDVAGGGVGNQLHRALLDGDGHSRRSERFLWAVPGNERAERFYTARGWQASDEAKDVETPSGAFPLQKWVLVG